MYISVFFFYSGARHQKFSSTNLHTKQENTVQVIYFRDYILINMMERGNIWIVQENVYIYFHWPIFFSGIVTG
jgi:hypothetical protein